MATTNPTTTCLGCDEPTDTTHPLDGGHLCCRCAFRLQVFAASELVRKFDEARAATDADVAWAVAS